MAKEASAAAARISEALKAIEGAQGEFKPETLEKLKAAVAGYLKKSKNAIEMADGDAGSALMFIKGAEQSFADIEKLTDDLITCSSDSKDREIARAGMKLEQQQLTLMVVLLAVAFAGIVVSFLIGRSISRPVVAMSSGDARTRGRQFRSSDCRASSAATKSARWPTRFRNSRCRPSPRPNARPPNAKRRIASSRLPAAPSFIVWPRVLRPRSAISSRTSAPPRTSWRIPPLS